MNKTRNLKNYSENENYLKRILKRKISFTQGLLVAFLISGAFGFSIPAYAGWNNLSIDTMTGSTGQHWGEGQSIKNRHAVVIGPIENERGQDRIEIAGNRYSHNIVVIGDGANTIQDGSTIIGQEAHGAGLQSTAVGQNAMAGNQGVAIGADTYAYGDSSIAIGNDDIANVYQDKLPTATIEKIYRDLYDTNTGLKSVTLNGKKYDFTYMYKDTFTDRYTLTPDHDNRIYSPTFSRGTGAIAIGSRAVAYGNGATTLGTLSFALADGSTAIGLRAFVSDNSNGGLAIGEESRVFASNSLAVGDKNESTNSGSMSYGYNAKAVGQSSIAIGHTTAANAMLTAASKNAFIEKLKDGHFDNGNTFKTGDNNKFVWSGFQGNQTDPYIQDKLKDISGLNFEYTTTGDVVLETDKQIKKTDKKGDNAIAVGHTAFADGKNSIALGTGTGVFGNSSVGIGSLTYVGDTAANTVAIGVGAYSEKENNVVLGTSAQTKGARSVLIGSSATSTADDVITIGYSASTDANKSVNIGHNSTIGNNAIDSILLGSDAFITNGAQNSIVVGKGAHIGTKGGTTTDTNSIAIGKDAFVNNASSSISLGNEAKADMDNSVALGYRSTTTYKYDPNSKNANPTLAGTDAATHEGYLPPGSSYQIPVDNSAGIISVGGWDNNGNVGLRRIVNVAPGFLDTDVATVGQLKALNYVKNEGNVVYYTVKDGKAVKLVKNHDGKFFAANTNNGEPLNDIEIPKNEVYIGAKGTNETTYTGTDKNTYADIGDNIIFGNIKDGKIAQNSDQAVTGNQLYDLETRILGTTINNNAPELNGITKLKNKNGQDSTANVTNFKEIVNANINKINEGISFGADNNNGTRQYLGSSLKINSGDITANGKNYKGNNLYTQYSASNGDGTIKIGLKEDPEFKEVIITNGPNLSETGLDMKNKKIINLTDGTLSETSKDAVTGSQLFATNKKVTDLHDVTTTLNEYFFDHEINKLDTDMGNIKSEGKGVIRTESIAAIDVVDAKNSGITVTSAETGTGKDLKKTFTVGLDANKIKQITGTSNLATDYAKADASNINGQNAEKWKTALGVSNIDLSYKSGTETPKKTTLANGLTLNGDKNITIATENNGIINYTLNSDLKGIANISKGADGTGTKITLNDDNVSLNNKKLTGLADGDISAASTDAVTGKQLNATNTKLATAENKIATAEGKITTAEGKITTVEGKVGGLETTTATHTQEITTLKTGVAGKANIALDNINDAGKGVIRTESIGAVDVTAAQDSGITVVSADTGTGKDLKKTFTVGLDENKIKQITGTSNLATEYAKADASNINGQNAEKWKTALGVSNIDLSYKSGADKTAKTTTLANGLTLNGDKNITIATENNGIINYTLNSDLKGITTISNKADNSGTVITLSDTGADFGGKKISNLADGQTDSDAVTVKQLKTLGIDPTLNTKKPVVIYDDDTKTTITVGTGAGQTAKLTNLTDAALTKTSTDAVTGKQLYDTNQTLQDIKTTMNKSWKIAANNDTAEKVDFDKAVRFKTDNNLELTYVNTNADEKVLTFALKDNLQIGNISIKNTKNPAGQGYTESVITGLTNTIWDKNNSVADRAATEGQLAQIVKDINASTGTADKTNVKYDSDTKEKITLGGIKNGAPEITDGVVLTNVKAGSGEKDAVNMKQILQLVGDKGVSYDAAKGQWTGVTFAGLKDKNGTAGTPAADIISAINANANKLNEGITFGADNQNGNTKQYLGSSLKVQSGDTTEGTDNYKGSNLYAKYTNQNGNGIITIGLKENPDFKEITLTDGGNTPYLTISKDAGSNGGKITGLADRTVSNNNIKDYGTGDNAGRAATEGALKDLADNLNTKSQLSYTANSDTNKKSVILTNGLNFTNGTNTTAFVDDNGIVKFNLNENLTGITTISKGINGQGAVITLNDDNIALNNKKLTGLADATTDTDAVNLKQLKDLGLDPTAQNKKPAVTYDDNTKTVITLGDGADVKLTNLKDGEIAKGSKDAVTGGQLFDKLNGIQNTINDTEISYAANTDKAKKVKLTDGFKFTNGTNTTAFVDDNGIVKFNLNNELTGITSIKGKGNKITLNTDNIDFGNQKLSGVANGTNDNDAVNISQFKPVVNALGGGAQINPDGSVKNPTYSLKTGADTATDYKNVGDALNAVDKAIDNSAKTDASNINVKDYINALNKGANISKPTGALVTDQNVHDYVSGEIGKLNDKVGTGNVAAGDTNTVSGDTVHKHLTQNYYDKTQTYNKTEVDNKIAGSVGNVALNITGDKGKGEINLKKDTLGFKGDKNITTNVNGKDVEIKLNENIAVKDVATEKITVSSPNNPDKTVTVENGNITAGKGDNKIEINGGNGNITFGEKPAGNNTDNRLTINGKDKTISNLAEGKNAGDAATKGQLDKAMEKAGDSKLTFTDNDGNKVAQASNGKFYKKSDIENGKPKANAKEVKDKEIKSSLVDKKGSTKNPTRLGNVAAGQKSTDAVNVGQLEAVRNEVNEKVQNNTRRINKIERSYKKGVANAVATAGVKFQEINTNEVTIGAAVGYYEDQGAVAVGIQGAPTENLRIHGTISATPGPEPEAAASVGFSWKFKIR